MVGHLGTPQLGGLAVASRPILTALGAEGEVATNALVYLRIGLVGTPMVLVTMAGTGLPAWPPGDRRGRLCARRGSHRRGRQAASCKSHGRRRVGVRICPCAGAAARPEHRMGLGGIRSVDGGAGSVLARKIPECPVARAGCSDTPLITQTLQPPQTSGMTSDAMSLRWSRSARSSTWRYSLEAPISANSRSLAIASEGVPATPLARSSSGSRPIVAALRANLASSVATHTT